MAFFYHRNLESFQNPKGVI